MLPLRVRVDLRAIVMKVYSTFSKSPTLEPRHKTVSFYIHDSFGGGESYSLAVGVFYRRSILTFLLLVFKFFLLLGPIECIYIFRQWYLIIRCSLASYSGHPLSRVGSYPSARDIAYSKRPSTSLIKIMLYQRDRKYLSDRKLVVKNDSVFSGWSVRVQIFSNGIKFTEVYLFVSLLFYGCITWRKS